MSLNYDNYIVSHVYGWNAIFTCIRKKSSRFTSLHAFRYRDVDVSWFFKCSSKCERCYIVSESSVAKEGKRSLSCVYVCVADRAWKNDSGVEVDKQKIEK